MQPSVCKQKWKKKVLITITDPEGEIAMTAATHQNKHKLGAPTSAPCCRLAAKGRNKENSSVAISPSCLAIKRIAEDAYKRRKSAPLEKRRKLRHPPPPFGANEK